MSKLVKPSEAMRLLSISRPTLEAGIRSGQIAAVKIGKSWRIALPDVRPVEPARPATAHQPEAA